MDTSIELNKTFVHCLQNIGFDKLPIEVVNTIFKDGRTFSHLIEKWIEQEYPLTHIPGCKQHDFIETMPTKVLILPENYNYSTEIILS